MGKTAPQPPAQPGAGSVHPCTAGLTLGATSPPPSRGSAKEKFRVRAVFTALSPLPTAWGPPRRLGRLQRAHRQVLIYPGEWPVQFSARRTTAATYRASHPSLIGTYSHVPHNGASGRGTRTPAVSTSPICFKRFRLRLVGFTVQVGTGTEDWGVLASPHLSGRKRCPGRKPVHCQCEDLRHKFARIGDWNDAGQDPLNGHFQNQHTHFSHEGHVGLCSTLVSIS